MNQDGTIRSFLTTAKNKFHMILSINNQICGERCQELTKGQNMFGIVLHEPEIPQNTGNIGRTCLDAGASLHLIEPLGFILSDKKLRRAGMDYWDQLDVERYLNYEDFLSKYPGSTIWYLSTKGHKSYTDVKYEPGDFLMFGREGGGIPEEILSANEEHLVRIPMREGCRSLNLCNSVAIVLYEALRQNGFRGLIV